MIMFSGFLPYILSDVSDYCHFAKSCLLVRRCETQLEFTYPEKVLLFFFTTVSKLKV